MENFEKLFSTYLSYSTNVRLDKYQILIEAAQTFLDSENHNQEFAQKLSDEIWVHRSLMAASKAYEGATDIDIKLATLCLNVARFGYPHNQIKIIPYLEDVLYYSKSEKERAILANEIQKLKNT